MSDVDRCDHGPIRDFQARPVIFGGADDEDPFNDPAYIALVRRLSRQIIPSWTSALIHSPACDGTGKPDPECSACKVFADWRREQMVLGESEGRDDGH